MTRWLIKIAVHVINVAIYDLLNRYKVEKEYKVVR